MKLTFERQTLRPKFAFTTSQASVREKQTIVVRLEADGETGFGEATHSRIYGQTLETTEAALRDIAARLADPDGPAADPFAVHALETVLLAEHDGQRAAIDAVVAAASDWCGKRLGVPVWRQLGLARPRVPVTLTIGIADLDEIRVKVDEAVAAGYGVLKVKVGGPEDEQTLGMIRERFEGPLLCDANQAWTRNEARERIRALSAFHPTIIEQPLEKDAWRDFAALRDLGVAPIFADESCERPNDLLKLHGMVDGVNIKLSKCGGIRQALMMIQMARHLGMKVMLGCFVSSSLAIAAATQLAGLVDFADLDGHLLLGDNDPWTGLGLIDGDLIAGEAPGLGVQPRA